MPSMPHPNKPRLYLIIYDRHGTNDGYDWALLRCPKHESASSLGVRYRTGMFYITKNGLSVYRWRYESEAWPCRPTPYSLVRVLLGKVADVDRLETILKRLKVSYDGPSDADKGWVCRALWALAYDRKALGRSVLRNWEWEDVMVEVEEWLRGNLERVRSEGLEAGAREEGGKGAGVPTLDLLYDRVWGTVKEIKCPEEAEGEGGEVEEGEGDGKTEGARKEDEGVSKEDESVSKEDEGVGVGGEEEEEEECCQSRWSSSSSV